ncbi:CRISPR-associated endonuclease Cas2 [Ectothiorhodospira mobilis]|uniref:CRISPR-associated endonuclease Cas2 n=1 Tax=Ectothiorhodospira mobilis TaxID=195064 RepID=UPI0019060C76|nr:CRISPR-associated endonuclease Cas2 [Ectothiorhodospira mobilis]MBK1693088.1 CRISPR-associated endonuclease Cas2 [Ectothiorhodospira mobilis]
MENPRLYIVAYDISDPKRWRRVFKIMHGYGEWVQLSIFQCRLESKRHAELISLLEGIIHHQEDHILLIDLGNVDTVEPKVVSLGKAGFEPVDLAPIIV